MVMKYALLLALVSCTLLVSVNAWTDMKDRLKGRVIHVESLLQRGRWLWQNDIKDGDGSRYLFVDQLAERDTYYTPTVQFQTTEIGGGKYLCLEPLSLPNYYLAAGFPAGGDKYTVKLEYTTYPEGDNRFFWKIQCESDTLDKCRFLPVRFEGDGHLMITDNWGGKGHNGGHYDATLGYKEGNQSYWRVQAPNPTDEFSQIYENSNNGSVDQLTKYSTMIGASQTQQTSYTVTRDTSIEIRGAFKAFSASGSHKISRSWATTDTTTYESAKTVEHDITIPARTRVVLKQLKGNYNDAFSVGADTYEIFDHPLNASRSASAPRKYTISYRNGNVVKRDKL